MFVYVCVCMREREREKERACERERKLASKNEIEIECERENTTSINACVTPPSASPVPHAHVCNPNPGAHNLCREHVGDRFRLPVPCRTHPSATSARTRLQPRRVE